MMPMEAPRQRWMNWSETIARPSKIAAALGINEAELIHWLDNAAPPGGGKLRGAHIRWATDEEIEQAKLEEAEEIDAEIRELSRKWVRWTEPSGKHFDLSMADAAKSFRNERNRTATAYDLARELYEAGGELTVSGHTLEVRDPPPPPRKPDGRRREARAKRLSESESQTTTEEPEMTDMEDQQQQRHGRSGQGVLVGDLLHPSLNSAAAALGVSGQGLSNKLRRHPEGCEIHGQWVQLSGSTTTPATTVKAARKGTKLVLSAAAGALLEQTAADAGLSPDDALLALLPPSEAMAAVLDSIDRERLAELTDLDWQRLQAIARVSGGEG